MKTKRIQPLLGAVIGGILLAGAANSVVASSTNYVIYSFDTEADYTNITDVAVPPPLGDFYWYPAATCWTLAWTAYPTNQFDPTLDSSNNLSSGSLKQFYYWSGTGFQQAFDFATIHGGKPIDGTKFAYMANDCRLDPSSTVATNNDGTASIGQMFIITQTVHTNNDLSVNALWDDVYRFNPDVASMWGQWATLQGTCAAQQTNIYTFFTGLQGSGWTNAVDGLGADLGYGLTIMNRDNVRFYTPPAPRPTLAIARAIAGVEYVPLPSLASPNAAGMVLNIGWAQNTNMFINWFTPGFPDSGTAGATPVTYSFNIPQFPRGSSNYVARMILSPYGLAPQGWRTHPEIDFANVIYLTITNLSDQTALANVLYKVNELATNDFHTTLATLAAPSIVGTWSLTASNEAMTLKAPSGASVNFSIPSTDVVLFNDSVTPLDVWLGVQLTDTNNLNQMVVIDDFKVTYKDSVLGTVLVTNYTFNPDIFATDWIVASDVPGVLARPTNTVYRLQWNGPAAGYTLQQATSLGGPWGVGGGTAPASSNTNIVSFINTPNVLSPNGLYRLYNPTP